MSLDVICKSNLLAFTRLSPHEMERQNVHFHACTCGHTIMVPPLIRFMRCSSCTNYFIRSYDTGWYLAGNLYDDLRAVESANRYRRVPLYSRVKRGEAITLTTLRAKARAFGYKIQTTFIGEAIVSGDMPRPPMISANGRDLNFPPYYFTRVLLPYLRARLGSRAW